MSDSMWEVQSARDGASVGEAKQTTDSPGDLKVELRYSS